MNRAATAALTAFTLAVVPGASGCHRRRAADATRDAGAGAGDGGAAKPGTATPGAASSRLPERVVLTGVVVKEQPPAPGQPARELYPEQLAKQLGAQLTATEWFYADPDQPPPEYQPRRARVELSIGYEIVDEAAHGGRSLLAVIEAQLVWQPRDDQALTIAENVLAELPLRDQDTDLDGLVAVHVEHAVADVGRGLIAEEAVRSGPPERAIEALGKADTDPELAVWALAVVGDRKLVDAYDAVVPLLRSDDENVRDAAIGALVALGDPRGVDAIADVAEFSDYAVMRRVIEAITAIGGERAEVYLEFVATGHENADIRKQAEQGLRRLADHP